MLSSSRRRLKDVLITCTDASDVISSSAKGPSLLLTSIWFCVGVWLVTSLVSTVIDEINDQDFDYVNGSLHGSHSRSKRFLYMTSDRRLNLPPGTLLDLEPTASLPGFNPLPDGYGSETAISIPFTINFDTLGWTSKENTFGEIPLLSSYLQWTGPLKTYFWDTVANFHDLLLGPPEQIDMRMAEGGGQRPAMFRVVEETLLGLGLDGRSCLLRAICEIHAEPLLGHGLFGEILHLFLSVSSSTNYLHILADYLEAELKGTKTQDCDQYKASCPLSLFGALTPSQREHENRIRKRFIQDESNYAHLTSDDLGDVRMTTSDIQKMEHNSTSMKSLSREKRMIFIGPARRLLLPEGSIFIFKPQIHLPWMTNLPKGFKSRLSIGVPLKMTCDDLGLTSVLNPFMRVPFFARKKRDTWKPLPGVNYAGGERDFLYDLLEHWLATWGLNGRSCLQRAVCEMNLSPFRTHGFFGEVLQLFLTPSKSLHPELRLKDYLDAEEAGKMARYCRPFYRSCPFSIFISEEEKENRIAATKHDIKFFVNEDEDEGEDEDDDGNEDNFL